MCETINNKYICEYCNNVFKRQCDLTRHINIVHLKTTIIHIKHKTKQCPKCKRQITICNFNKHLKSCNGIKIRKYTAYDENGKRKAWNKGLTKQNNEIIRSMCETYQRNEKLGKHHKPKQYFSHERRQHLREVAIRRGLGWVRQTKKILYNDVKLGSTYEVELAKDLDANNIKWNIPKRIKYFDLNNKLHYYSPDLYLPDYNIYLDPKNDFLINNINPRLGYKDSDKIKWVCEQNNIKVFILNKYQLTWKYIKENLLV